MSKNTFTSCWTSIVLLWISVSALSAEQFGLFTYEVIENTIPNDTTPQTEGYELRLGSVASLSDLEDQGESVVIISLVGGDHLHIRIFDADGNKVADRSEDESEVWQGLALVKEGLLADPTADESDATQSEREVFIEAATSIIGGEIIIVTVSVSITITITGYPRDAVGHVDIPAEIDGKPVTVIGAGAFAGCNRLTSVTLPESVTRIEGAHRWFHRVIGKGAFEDCDQLTHVTLPPTVDLGANTFKGCKALPHITIPEGVGGIPSGLFYGCEALTNIMIPASMTYIDYHKTTMLPPFGGCVALESIDVRPGNRSYASVDGVLVDANKETLIRCPAGKRGTFTIPQGITTIEGVYCGFDDGCGGEGAFANCTRLTDITIPESVMKIGRQAFLGCGSLNSVIVPGSVSRIGEHAFSGCNSLRSVIVLDGVTKIDHDAFSGCSNLRSVRLPNSIRRISSGTFANCGLTTFTIPPSVWDIDYLAFAGCELTSITIPSSVTSLYSSAFSGCKALSAIAVEAGNPNYSSVDGVLYDAGKTKLLYCPEGKPSVSIPEGITEIQGGAFGDCSLLTKVAIPASVEMIGGSAFRGCSALESLVVENGNLHYVSVDDIILDVDQTTLITTAQGKTSMTIPDTVTKIGNAACLDWRSLTNITIPSSVTEIGRQAFSGCSRLTSVTIPKSVTMVGDGAFLDCSLLTTVTIAEGVTGIGHSAFEHCPRLGRITIPKSLESFGNGAFGNCVGLTSVTFAEGVTSISPYAFYKCAGLTSIAIPSSVTQIGSSSFSECTGLTKVTFEEGVREIGSDAFFGCTGLTSITIPSSLTNIERRAFSGCSRLASVFFLGNAQEEQWTHHWGTVFSETAPDRTIYYRSGSTGFSPSLWNGFQLVMIDEAIHPAASWLLSHDLPYDTDLNEDPGLLTAYALNRDPNGSLVSSMPEPLIDLTTGNLKLSFYAANPGITYSVETSTDLRNWTTGGLTLSDLGPDNRMTASVRRDMPSQFMRLVVVSAGD